MRAERFGGSLALILADLDDFKQVNDRYGHQAGDDVLQTFADILRATVREIDLPSRYGEEEFAVLLPQTDLEGAQRLAERLCKALAARPMPTHPGALVAVTASFGVAAFPDSPDSGRTSQRPTKPSIVPSALERTVSSRRTRVPSSALPISVVSFARSSTIRRCPVPDPEVASE